MSPLSSLPFEAQVTLLASTCRRWHRLLRRYVFLALAAVSSVGRGRFRWFLRVRFHVHGWMLGRAHTDPLVSIWTSPMVPFRDVSSSYLPRLGLDGFHVAPILPPLSGVVDGHPHRSPMVIDGDPPFLRVRIPFHRSSHPFLLDGEDRSHGSRGRRGGIPLSPGPSPSPSLLLSYGSVGTHSDGKGTRMERRPESKGNGDRGSDWRGIHPPSQAMRKRQEEGREPHRRRHVQSLSDVREPIPRRGRRGHGAGETRDGTPWGCTWKREERRRRTETPTHEEGYDSDTTRGVGGEPSRT